MRYPAVRPIAIVALAGGMAFGGLSIEAEVGGGAQASGFSAFVLDKSTYAIGDSIRLCWLLPAAGTMTLTQHDAGGKTEVLHSGADKGSTCLGGTIVGPLGHNCEVLEFDTPRGSGSIQTCFEVTNAPVPAEPAVADQPQLIPAVITEPGTTDLPIDGVGFQLFSDAAHGVTIAVKGPDGSEVDSDEIFPSVNGTLHLVLHTASYGPGEYTVSARYSFVTALTGQVNQVRTDLLTDGFVFTVE